MGLDNPTKGDLYKHLEESKERAKNLGKILTKETARGCALVAGALLDERLLLERRFFSLMAKLGYFAFLAT